MSESPDSAPLVNAPLPGPPTQGGTGPAPRQETPEQMYARARHLVYERLALASTVIWVVGTGILMMTIVPYIAHPQVYVAIASVVPIFPATLPWLFWGALTDAVFRRWTAQAPEH